MFIVFISGCSLVFTADIIADVPVRAHPVHGDVSRSAFLEPYKVRSERIRDTGCSYNLVNQMIVSYGQGIIYPLCLLSIINQSSVS